MLNGVHGLRGRPEASCATLVALTSLPSGISNSDPAPDHVLSVVTTF